LVLGQCAVYLRAGIVRLRSIGTGIYPRTAPVPWANRSSVTGRKWVFGNRRSEYRDGALSGRTVFRRAHSVWSGSFFGVFGFHLFDIVPIARDTVIGSLGDGVIVLDAQQRIVDLNPSAQRLFGWSASKAIGRTALELFKPWPDLSALCYSGTATQIELVIGAGDARQDYDVRMSPLPDRRGRLMGQVLILSEITERKRTQAQLLQHQRALAVLEERERLAREMHDSLGQVLGYVNTQAQAVRELLSRGQTTTADTHLARLADIAQDAQADVREYILSVKAAIAPEQGLIPTLKQYLGRFGENYGIHTELCVPETLEAGAFSPVVEVQLLRIIQEALHNVRKHANAHSVRVSIAAHADQAQVEVEDDGGGFDPAQLQDPGQHFGVRIMRERAQEVGGSLTVQSAPGRGTKVIVWVPLQPRQR